MKITYENQGSYSYMVYEVENADLIDTMCLGMITNNSITGLAPTIFTQMDGKNFFKYNISSKVTAAQFFEGVVNRKQVSTIFLSFINALLAAEEYMIGPESMIMDMNYMFIDVATYDMNLVCLPIIERRKRQFDYVVFFKNIIFSAKFDPTESYDYVGRMINYLNNAMNFSLTGFKEIINELNYSGQAVQFGQEEQQISQLMQSANAMPSVGNVQNPQEVQYSQPFVRQEQPIVPSNRPIDSSVPPDTAQSVPSGSGDGADKKMGLFNLLTHYSKENAALYKEQKNKEKSNDVPKAAKPVKESKERKAPKATDLGFAIPGQETKPKFDSGQAPQPINAPAQLVQSVPQPAPMMQQTVMQNQPRVGMMPIQGAAAVPAVMPQRGVTRANFGETTVLNVAASGETTVLSMSMEPNGVLAPYLIRTRTGERSAVNKPMFRIGKEKSYVDFFIGDNTAISRSHAYILAQGNRYYIVDTNSKNHTFVNGQMIQSNTEVEIMDGARICLANEEFEFRLM